MTAATVGQTGTQLAYREYLITHRDEMVDLLVSDHQEPRVRAEAMIDQLWPLAIEGIVKDHADQDIDAQLAELILNEAIGFLLLSATDPGYGPSELVDFGWHKLMQFSKQYAVLCQVIAGRHLHHEPEGLVLPEGYDDGRAAYTITDTVEAMRLRGVVNDLLWVHPGGCDGCCNMRCRRA